MSQTEALVKGLPTTLPGESFTYLIGVLTGTEKLDRLRGVKAGYEIVGFLLSKFLGEASTAANPVLPKKASKKQIAAALQSLKDGSPQAKGFPAWLVPVLLDLVNKWLANKK